MAAVSCLRFCAKIVISSAYVMTCVLGCVGTGMSCVNRLKSVGERTEPCGTPFLKCCVRDDLPRYKVYACLPERKLASHFL